jgi:hypothetical protein
MKVNQTKGNPRTGKESKGKERKGKERKGKERKGKERKGKGKRKGRLYSARFMNNGIERSDSSSLPAPARGR